MIQIEGPDRDLLTIHEVAAYLRISVRGLQRMVKAGLFPRPIGITPGSKVWTAADVGVFRYWQTLRPRLRGANPRNRGRRPATADDNNTTGGDRPVPFPSEGSQPRRAR